MTTASSPGPDTLGPPAVVRTVALAADDQSLLEHLPGPVSVAWVTGSGAAQSGLVGWGEAARYETSGPERFSRAQRWWAQWSGAVEPSDAARDPGTGPVAFASFTFDPADPTPSVVLVPEVLVVRRGARRWLSVVAPDAGRAAARLDRALAELGRPVAVPDAPRDVRYAEGALTVPDWQRAVAAALERIADGELDKVVLARDVSVECSSAIDERHLVRRLAASYPSCWTFVVDGLVGSTPEMLVRRLGSQVTSRVLAGTMRRSADSSRDASLASALLASAKDHQEHEYAVRSVAAALAAHCTDLVVPDEPSLLPLANVQHLATDISGELADGSPVLALAASLHPTAAVCGTPTERALEVIRELEGMARGRYAGPVGWFDSRGDGELGIALRCGTVVGSSARLFAGCGLVAGSDPVAELAESQAKFLAMREALEST